MMEKTFLTLSREARDKFYEAKFLYFGKMTFIVAVLVGFASLSYYITDCQLIGSLQRQTLFPRFSILIPLIGYLVFYPRISNYRIKTFCTLAIGQMVHYCTIWAITFLPDQSYVCAGAVIIQVSVFMIAFSAPFAWAVTAQGLIILNLLLSNLFIGYDEFEMLLTMNVPLFLGFCVCHYWLTMTMYGRFVLQQKLSEQTYIDQLTGLYNRHKLQGYVDDMGRFLPQYESPISVMIMDLDFFKNINDTYGHDKGDIVLESVGALIKSQFEEESSICLRWGGEEFVVFLFHCEEKDAYSQADALRKKIEKQENGVCPVTVSVGVAQYSVLGGSYKSTIKDADKALYEAKHKGRNRTIAFSKVLGK